MREDEKLIWPLRWLELESNIVACAGLASVTSDEHFSWHLTTYFSSTVQVSRAGKFSAVSILDGSDSVDPLAINC